jgi:hypothetical protein
VSFYCQVVNGVSLTGDIEEEGDGKAEKK